MKFLEQIPLFLWCCFLSTAFAGSFSAEAIGLDRAPVLGRNLPYAPADGSTAVCNPPPFLWLPASKAEMVKGYHVQVSQSADFPAGN